MNEELPQITGRLREISEEARQTFGGLSEEQLNWKPAAGSWSIAQCFEHLIRGNNAFDPQFEAFASGNRKQTFWENYSPLSGFFANLLLKSLKNDQRKYKAPSQDIVPPSDIPGDIIERFAAHQEEMIGKIESIADVDWKKTVVTSPFLKLMTYRLDKAFEIAIQHERRHFRQALRVLEAEGFPKAV